METEASKLAVDRNRSYTVRFTLHSSISVQAGFAFHAL